MTAARDMTVVRASTYEVHLARVEAAAKSLYEANIGAWDNAETDTRYAWLWMAEQALVEAERAAGRTKTRRKGNT